jgi:probable rRNA maturation factor
MPISVARPDGAQRFTTRLAPALRALVRVALALEGKRAGEIAIVLADDAALRELNRRYRGIDRATDVLSFGYDEPTAGGATVDGDLVISLDRVAEQSRRFRVTRGEELARLVIHGALHLAGLDHHETRERAHMRRREEQAMRAARADVRRLERVLVHV